MPIAVHTLFKHFFRWGHNVSGNRTAFSSIFYKLVPDQLTFFTGATDPVPDGRMLFRASESGISRVRQANGDIKYELTYAIDDNKKASDGRLFLKDEFVLAAEGRSVKSFNRAIEYNNQGDTSLWKKRLDNFRLMQSPGLGEVQTFADTVLTKEDMVNHLKGPGKSAMGFLGQTYAALEEIRQDRKIAFKFMESDTKVSLTDKADRWEIKFSYVLDADNDSSNGRILLEDYFKVNKKDFKVTSHLRRWALHPDSAGNAEFFSTVTQLNKKPHPARQDAEAFLTTMLPVLFSSKAPNKVADSSSVSPAPEKKAETPVTPPKKEKPVAPRKAAHANSYTFSQHPSELKENTSLDSANRRLNYALKAYLSRKGRTLNISKLKFNMRIHFNSKTGYVDKVEFSDAKATGGSISDKALQGMFYEISQRVHQNLRGQKDLKGKVLSVPYSLVFA